MAINESTSGLVFNKEEAAEILDKAQEGSFVMQLGREVSLPGSGIDYQMVTGDPSAAFVAEGAAKPVADPTLAKKTMVPHKIAVIEAVSDELLEDRNALVNHLVDRLPGAFAKAIDEEVIKDGTQSGALANFGYLGAAQQISTATDMYGGLVNAEFAIGDKLYTISDFVFSAKAKKALREAKDNNGRPIFDNWNLQDGRVASVALGYPIVFNNHAHIAGVAGSKPEIIGFAGQWDKFLFGVRDGLTIDFSKEASIVTAGGDTINCFQDNMTAIRAEMRIGTLIQDIDAFAKLAGETPDSNRKARK